MDTRDGPRPIEEIRAGDMVTARDQMTGEIEERQVVQTFEHADSAVVEVTYVDAQGKVETLGATPDHPFHVDGVGWVDAGKLQPGQRVTGLDGDYLVVQHVALDDERHTTYNFEVGEFHTYFVGNGDAWVHNAAPNPHGRLGSPPHRAVVNGLKRSLKKTFPKHAIRTEYFIQTPGGFKDIRFADIAVVDIATGLPVEIHQVGLQTQGGNPVKRERKAIIDIVNAHPDARTYFHPYNPCWGR